MCLEGKDRNVWLDGLKKLNRQGVHIRVDGISCSEDNFDMLLGMPDDKFYYEACVIEEPGTRKFAALDFHRTCNQIIGERRSKRAGVSGTMNN